MRLTVQEAEGKLAELVHQAAGGQEVVIVEQGGQAVRLVPASGHKRMLGSARGQFEVDPSFERPWTDEELKDLFGI